MGTGSRLGIGHFPDWDGKRSHYYTAIMDECKIQQLGSCVFIALLILVGCGQKSDTTSTPTSELVPQAWGKKGNGLRLGIEFDKRIYKIGETLEPPVVRFKNEDENDEDLELVGPTLVVVGCTIEDPSAREIKACLAMPTGISPYAMPKRILRKGEILEIPPHGIWHYVDDKGYNPYIFSNPGKYRIYCTYEEIDSNEVIIELR